MRARAALKTLGWLIAAACLSAGSAAAATAGATPDARATSPVATVNGTAPGQTGYVHFFIVREAGTAEWETQVGIEMPDQRIAWSFFELGVVVSPFMESGLMPANRKQIEFQYLYGVQPFPDEASMRVLRSELEARVLPYAEAAIPYCTVRGPSDEQCLSCLSFVMRMLFPGATPDHVRAQKTIYDTDDLLLYLAGLHGLRDRAARLKRVDELALPADVREDVVRLVNMIDIPGAGNAAASTGKASARGRRLAKPTQRTQQRPKS